MVEFPLEEYKERVKRATALMAQNNIDAIMVTADFSYSANYRYLSGHVPRDYQPNFSRPHVMILTADGNAALVTYIQTEKNATEESWVENVRSYIQPFTHVPVKEALKELGLENARIGAEIGEDQRLFMQLEEFDQLRNSLPNATFVDASQVLWRLRMIKSAAEVECIRVADKINGEALDKMFTTLKPGETEVDIATKVALGMVEAGAYRPPYAQVLISTSPKFRRVGHRGRFMDPSTDPLLEGDVIFVDSGAIHKGYWGEFNRMGVVGKPSELQARSHKIIREIVQQTIADVIKPGISSREVIEHMANLYRKHGVDESQFRKYLEHPFAHLCHGIGLASSEPPFVRFDNEAPLEPGMVFSVEAYLQEDMVYGSEEDVVVTETGAEILSEIDTGLYVITGEGGKQATA